MTDKGLYSNNTKFVNPIKKTKYTLNVKPKIQENLQGEKIEDKKVETSFTNKTKNQLKSTNQIKTSPLKSSKFQDEKQKIEITSFQNLIELANKYKEIDLK